MPDAPPAEILPAASDSTSLLPVINQDFVAAPADVGAVFLQAGQHRLVTIIHDGAAMPNHVAGAGIVLALRHLRGRRRSKDNRGKGDKRKKRNKPDHHFNPRSVSPDGDQIPYIATPSTHSNPGRNGNSDENSSH